MKAHSFADRGQTGRVSARMQSDFAATNNHIGGIAEKRHAFDDSGAAIQSVHRAIRVIEQIDVLGTKKQLRRHSHLPLATLGDEIAERCCHQHFGPQLLFVAFDVGGNKVRIAEKIRSDFMCGPQIELRRGTDFEKRPLVHEPDTIRQRQRFFLVVGHVDRG